MRLGLEFETQPCPSSLGFYLINGQFLDRPAQFRYGLELGLELETQLGPSSLGFSGNKAQILDMLAQVRLGLKFETQPSLAHEKL